MTVLPSEDLPAAVVVQPRPSPDARAPSRLGRAAVPLAWLAVVVPAIYQLTLLVEAIAGRIAYPYDLEWMEGGMLHHALRIGQGQGIYVPPSVDFIPYLYTPLYPTLIALFGAPFGVSYLLGRILSVIGLAGIAAVALASLASERPRHGGVAVAGTLLALGLFAACYPFVEGWYDIVRADTFFLFMITAGIAGLALWARSDEGIVGHGKVAAGAAVLALAFFCKQTGIFYVALGGLIVLCLNWRRVPIYLAMAGAIGLGGTWILNRSSNGWFWTYVSEIHRAHDFNMDRFYRSFGLILWHFPALSCVVAATLVLVLVTAIRARSVPAPARPFLLWTSAYAVSTVVGAIGWGTEFAHYNAYIPALLHGALAAGAALRAIVACVRLLATGRRRTELLATAAALAAAIPLAVTCATFRWQPRRYIPTAADVAAGDHLIAHLKAMPGDIWMPSHPWYVVLAGKQPHVHRMGIKDVTTRQTRPVVGLDDKLRTHAFSALVLDNRDLQLELPAINEYYRQDVPLPPDERPRVFTGATVVPETIWVPREPPPQ